MFFGSRDKSKNKINDIGKENKEDRQKRRIIFVIIIAE